MAKPTTRPADPRFSSGPTKKRPGWTPDFLKTAPLGLTHRGPVPKARIKMVLDKIASVLQIPEDYSVVLTPASDTGALEAAMWSMLGARGVDVFACDEFGRRWLIDARDELKPEPLSIHETPYGTPPDYSKADFSRDVIFTWNATAAGVRIPNGDWIEDDREGLTICDATSAAFAMDLPWDRLDVTTFSWQKCLGGEAQHGIAILSPRARARLAEYRPAWPVPRILQLFEAADPNAAIYEGSTINTPSIMCVEDCIDALDWAASVGGVKELIARTDANYAALARWVAQTDWVDFLVQDEPARSHTSVTLVFADPALEGLDNAERWKISRAMGERLASEGAAYDIIPHPKAPAGMRIWCGPTIETSDVEALGPWLDWAYRTASDAQTH